MDASRGGIHLLFVGQRHFMALLMSGFGGVLSDKFLCHFLSSLDDVDAV